MVTGSGNTQSLLIGIVSVTVIIPAFIYVLFLLRNHFVDKTKNWIYPVPKLLIIFTPSFSSHSNVVLALVEYLKKYCNVEPLVDELHILNSESRDPFKWCNEALKSAEFVMVVASPYHKNMRVSDSVYQSTDVLLLRLLQERLASDSRKTRVFVLMLPYARKEDVPEEAVHLRRYHFPKDLNKMLKFVHKDKLLPYYLNSKIQGGKRTYKMFGTKLKNCIKEAEEYIYRKRIELDEVAAETETREEKELSLEECLLKSPKTGKQISENGRIKDKKTVAEMAGHVFREFPGRLEDMNLSGDETESLVTVKRKSLKHDVVNLDTLDL
ncbi:hypothetical protein RUM43_002092 [Polyplax serrata]|uniref:SEFIR domain-containing protein n=1 Tax=Polyplax serrata TaxID=468196 RepID=A0AAN8S2G3_POLSC